MNLARVLVLASVATLLAGCGGGDGGGDDGGGGGGGGEPGGSLPMVGPPNPGPPAATAAGLLSVSVPGVHVYAGPPDLVRDQVIAIQLKDTVGTTYVDGYYTTSGIEVAHLYYTAAGVSLSLKFRNPAGLSPGDIADTVTLRACTENPCVRQIGGSPLTIPVTYTVLAASSPPVVRAAKDTIYAQGFMLDSARPPAQTVNLDFSNLGTNEQTYVTLNSNRTVVWSTGYNEIPQSGGVLRQVAIQLMAPEAFEPGTFTDVVSARVCLDFACTREVAGSPVKIGVEYTISNAVPGPAGFSVRIVNVWANDIVWDATRERFYASIKNVASSNPNSIAVLDPVSGQFTSYVGVGMNPGQLEISADGQYLYVVPVGVGSIQRLNLPSLTLDATIPIGTQPQGRALTASELHVSPASAHTFAMVRSTTSGPYDLVVFDDTTMRAQAVGGAAPERVATFRWDGGTRIFGVNNDTSGIAYQIAVDANGPAITAQLAGVAPLAGRAYLADARMIMQTGLVFDPVSFVQHGSFEVGAGVTSAAALPDPSSGRSFFLTNGSIKAFDLVSLAPLASHNLSDFNSANSTARLVRWGSDGLAILNYHPSQPGVMLINGPFVQP